MFNFDEKKYLEMGKNTYSLREQIEGIADEVSKKGFSNIFFISSGGSIAMMQPFEYAVKTLSTIPVFSEIAAEVILTGNKQLTEKSIVILASKSGDTKETVAAAKYCKERGITTIALIRTDNSPLGECADYSIIDKVVNFGGGDPENMSLYLLIFRLMYNNNEFPKYNEFAEQLRNLPEQMVSVRNQADQKAEAFSEKYKDEPYQLWIGSGNLCGKTYSYAMCVLEEMQWMKTKSMHAAEFFHGTIEIVEEDTCVVLLKGEDETRGLIDRVERFAEQYTDKLTVFDSKDYVVEGFSDEFRKYLCPMILTAALDRISIHLEHKRDHSLDLRRYYRVLEY
jgi:fructoselysine-6-phosphate deglycase